VQNAETRATNSHGGRVSTKGTGRFEHFALVLVVAHCDRDLCFTAAHRGCQMHEDQFFDLLAEQKAAQGGEADRMVDVGCLVRLILPKTPTGGDFVTTGHVYIKGHPDKTEQGTISVPNRLFSDEDRAPLLVALQKAADPIYRKVLDSRPMLCVVCGEESVNYQHCGIPVMFLVAVLRTATRNI